MLWDGEACPEFKMHNIVKLGNDIWNESIGETNMWYVIQTLGGEEEKTANVIRNMISPDLIRECFVLKRERIKKFHGNWNKTEEVLFRGYAFVVSERPGELYEQLRRVPKLTRVLGREDNFFFSLGEKEEKLIRGLGGRKHKTSLSRIAVGERRELQVIDGPLKDYAGHMVKMDLHKREVTVRVEFMGRTLELKMGIEIVDVGRTP